MSTQRLILGRNEYIETAYAYRANGPGWSNSLVAVIIFDRAANKYRREVIQPEHQSAEIVSLFDWSALAHNRMTVAAYKASQPKQRIHPAAQPGNKGAYEKDPGHGPA